MMLRPTYNHVEIMGNVGKDPVYSCKNGQKGVARFSVATAQEWRDDDGIKQTRTDWHQVVISGTTADWVEKNIRSGAHVFIIGSLRHSRWEDHTGQTRYATEVSARSIKLISQ